MYESPLGRGISDYFHCFTCNVPVWDCDHLIDDRLQAGERLHAPEPSLLRSFTYDGDHRILEVEFAVNTPFVHGELPLPPPPRVIQYHEVPRYVFTDLIKCKTARAQERKWENSIQRKYKCQTVRTVCRLPRIYKWSEARNVRRFTFDDHLSNFSTEGQQTLVVVVGLMKILLLRTLAPRRVAGLGGLLECQGCGAVGPDAKSMRHRNCFWFSLT
jgi:hypothetical protein